MKITENKLRAIVRKIIKESMSDQGFNNERCGSVAMNVLDDAGLLYSDFAATIEENDDIDQFITSDPMTFVKVMTYYLYDYLENVDPEQAEASDYDAYFHPGPEDRLFVLANELSVKILKIITMKK